MEVLHWIGDHPVLTVLFTIIVCSTIETVAATFARRS